MSSTEDDRAALWRQQTANRVAYQRDLWLSLQAPPEPRQAVIDAWAPVLMAQLERQAGATDPEEDP
jgi:hypothetical protein